jgi:predicted TIM-barrel fold metal-dependent hydrolase
MQLFDADAHVVEPPELWQERVPARLRDAAPKVVRAEGDADVWLLEGGKRKLPVLMLFSTPGVSPVDWTLYGSNYQRIRRGAFDPKARLADMDTDMIFAQVLHPSIALSGAVTFSPKDAELQIACTRAYNDWLSEFSATDPARLIGLTMIPMCGIDAALAELERARKLPGLCGALLGAFPSGQAVPTPEDDRFWAMCQDLDIPVVIHVSLGGGGEGSESEFSGTLAAPSPSLVLATINLERSARGIMQALSQILLTGVLQRFPKLRVIGTETGVGWIPYFLEQTDDNFLRHRFWAKSDLKMLPSEYFARQCYSTFQVDTYGVRNRASMLHNIMWSSDYPHSGADWPNSKVTVARNLAGVPDAERELIVETNCRVAFGLGA